jgi:hypothetical protein
VARAKKAAIPIAIGTILNATYKDLKSLF